jgi:hypothetical protein
LRLGLRSGGRTLIGVSAIALVIGINEARHAAMLAQPTAPPPLVAAENSSAPARPAPAASASAPPPLPGSVPLDHVKLPPVTSPTSSVVVSPAPAPTTARRPPRTSEARPSRTERPTARSTPPVASAGATPVPAPTPGPLVVVQQPDGSSRTMRAYRWPDGSVAYYEVVN